MPCLANTFGHAPQPVQRDLIQLASSVARTRNTRGFRFASRIARSCAFTPFRQAFFSAPRNKPLTHATAGPATMTGYGEPWGSEFADRVTRITRHNLGHGNRVRVDSKPGSMRQGVTPEIGQTQNGCSPSALHCRRADV